MLPKNSKLPVIFGLVAVFLVGIIMRYPLDYYQCGNIDSYAYIPYSTAIINSGTIPWLLHPLLSFIGIYPGSDTTGFMLFQSA
ncbi:MAG: hypothetical protein ACP5JR_07655, partial [Thermoplasmata archaeon]